MNVVFLRDSNSIPIKRFTVVKTNGFFVQGAKIEIKKAVLEIVCKDGITLAKEQ